MAKKVLVIEDDANIAEILKLYLERDGFSVYFSDNGKEGIEKFKQLTPDLVLLDILMPVLDGWDTLREIRSLSSVPIIMLTAKGEMLDKVSGLEMGADDYIVKPFEIKELLARIRTVMRRFDATSVSEAKKLEFDNLVIDMDAFELLIKGKRVNAPPKEMELLFYLASSPNRVYTRNQLLDAVWGFDYFGDSRTVDVHVKRLREKLDGASEKWSLNTVWGVGYNFKIEDNMP